MKQRRRRQREGFTLIEVMVSLGVMTVGAMAIIALQQHSMRANRHAREMSTAVMIAERWIERLKQDAHSWTRAADPNVAGDDAFVLNNTTFLREIADATAPQEFQTISNATATTSRAFNWLGEDVGLIANAADPIIYCAAFRLDWVLYGRAMKTDVRVWWGRPGFSAHDQCDPPSHAVLNPGGTDIDNYHVVYASTVIRMVPVER